MNLKDLLLLRGVGIAVDDEIAEKLEKDFVIVKDLDSRTVLGKIRDLVEKNNKDMQSALGFSYQLRPRDPSQVEYVPKLKQLCLRRDRVRTCAFGDADEAHKATVLTAALSVVQEALLSGISICCRGLFYRDPILHVKQEVSDEAIFDLCCILGCSRAHLNIHATTKGLFVGPIVLKTESGDEIKGRQCRRESVKIPTHTGKITKISGEVDFVLVIEKQSAFEHLVQQDFHDMFNCVLVTGCGFPDVSTRTFVFKLWKHLGKPVYGLMDADPHGVSIFSVYKYGSANTSFDNIGLATPEMIWIGVNLYDLAAFKNESLLRPLTDMEISLLDSLRTKSYIVQDYALICNINNMIQLGMKGQIECLHYKGMKGLSLYIQNQIKIEKVSANSVMLNKRII